MLNKRKNILERSTSRVKTQITAVMIGGLLFTSMSAQAIVPTDTQVQLRIDMRDLTTKNGISAVYKQMSRKAELACAVNKQRTLSNKRVARACASDLLASFVSDLDDHRITGYHKSIITI